MSESPKVINPIVLETLKNFQPPVKRKLTHVISDTDSSPESSPVRGTRKYIVDLDSDSEEEITSNQQQTPKKLWSGMNGINDVHPTAPVFISTIDLEDNSNSNDPISTRNHFSGGESSQNETSNSQSVMTSQIEDDNMSKKFVFNNKVTVSLKRKNSDTKNKKKKRRKMFNNEFDDSSSVEKNPYETNRVYDSDEEEDSYDDRILVPRKKVVEFIDSASEKDLIIVPSMSEKKISLIMTHRPFETWDNIRNKFTSIKGLNCSMLNNVIEILTAKDIVNDLLAKCEKMASKTEKRIAAAEKLISVQPKLLNPSMKVAEHQMISLNWLAVMRKDSLNSILADEMGLGKTIQVIAFLAYLKENGLFHEGFPHLVVVPSSTLDNWSAEFEKWCPSMKVLVYHGNQDDRRYMRHEWFKNGFGDADVILTTYSCATSQREEKKMFRVKEFNYIIFDEAHKLKNMNSQTYEALFLFNGNFKILLTGTPMQNNLLELISLLIFLMPNLFRNKIDQMKLLFSKCSKIIDETSSNYEKERVNQAKRIIDPFMLRRLKEDVLENLPAKTTTVKKCSLTEDQQKKYNGILEDFKHDMELEDNNCYMSYFMMLRKLSNHPLLLRYHFTQEKTQKMADRLAVDPEFKGTNSEYICEDLYFKSDFELHSMCLNMECLKNLNYNIPDEEYNRSGKFEVLTPMLHSLRENGHRVLIFSQFILMLDVLEEYCRIQDFSFLRLDGSTQTENRQELINLYNSDDKIFIFLLSTKAGGLGINLTSADTVIIHDLDFNPYNDKQAEDRCHRIGQTKPVQVIKLVSENTVEEGILEAANRKLFLEKEVISRNGDEKFESKTVLQLLQESLKRLSNV